MQAGEHNIVAYLKKYALLFPEKTVFIFLGSEGTAERRISYRELDARVTQLVCKLANRQLKGERGLLIYQDILEFIVAFLACQHLGIIPVPVPHATGIKQLSRLSAIIHDAQAVAVFCLDASVPQLQKSLPGLFQSGDLAIITTDTTGSPTSTADFVAPQYSDTAFIQYTSGSTGMPKGVVISGTGLLHNLELIKNTFGCNENSVIFSWLPFHHDMGLIGNILQTIYIGATGILMSPFHFMQQPKRWLECISKYGVTHSGGPNFSYDLCVEKISPGDLAQLDLSGWKVAYNGSEPIRAETLRRFSDHFKPAGFIETAFFPCYGLAEATLLVSGYKSNAAPLVIYIDKNTGPNARISIVEKNDPNARSMVASGEVVAGVQVKIIGKQTGKSNGELEEGEVFIAGPSVTTGYWNRGGNELIYNLEGTPYINTGDVGFLYRSQLFITGRTREMLIIRGQNHFPYDIEEKIGEADVAIESNGVVIIELHQPEEALVVIAEIKRSFLTQINAGNIITAIRRTVKGITGIDLYDVILTTPLAIPRTTSGKLQRTKCRLDYQHIKSRAIASGSNRETKGKKKEKDDQLLLNVNNNTDYTTIRSYLVNLIESRIGDLPVTQAIDDSELTDMGVDSLKAMELINAVNRDLNINLDAAKIFRNTTLSMLINTIENTLWLKKEFITGKEINI